MLQECLHFNSEMQIYNFDPPAALKGLADQVASPGHTLSYSAGSSESLLEDKNSTWLLLLAAR
jgi:FMN-dependent NADH-azoreductase